MTNRVDHLDESVLSQSQQSLIIENPELQNLKKTYNKSEISKVIKINSKTNYEADFYGKDLDEL